MMPDLECPECCGLGVVEVLLPPPNRVSQTNAAYEQANCSCMGGDPMLIEQGKLYRKALFGSLRRNV